MSEKTTIKINPQKPSNLEFDVVISGLDDVTPKVRFVLCDVKDGLDWVAHCTSVGDNRWAASLPALKGIKSTPLNFRVEVVAEEYFFTPAYGQVVLVTVKDVDFDTKAKKPKVSASFNVSQPTTNTDTVPVTETSTEATGGGTPPTTALLSPEEDGGVDHQDAPSNPGMYDVQPDVEPEVPPDMAYTVTTVAISQTPGDTQLPIPEFDPKLVASNIIRSKVGSMSRPTSKGRLFNRSDTGQAVVDGLESPETKRVLADKAAKVKEILKSV